MSHLISMLGGAVFGALIIFGVTKAVNDSSWQDSAVARGHAEYFLDDGNIVQWRWKDCK